MTNQEAIEMMKAKLECMTREVSGVDLNCNAKKCDECDLCYAQGNMGEQKEWLKMGIKALESQKTAHWIKYGIPRCGEQHYQCTSCGYYINFGQWGELYTKEFKYRPNCFAKMERGQK